MFGMHATDVTPPARAAAVPVAMVSSSSRPGSRRWTCMSIRPGQTIMPGRVDGAVGLDVRLGADAEDAVAADPEVGDLVDVLGRVDDAAVADAEGVHAAYSKPGRAFGKVRPVRDGPTRESPKKRGCNADSTVYRALVCSPTVDGGEAPPCAQAVLTVRRQCITSHRLCPRLWRSAACPSRSAPLPLRPPCRHGHVAALAATLILGAAAAHLGYMLHSCPLDLAPDEAHYWDWSRHLDWSYYSKGPLVAYLIRGGCALSAPGRNSTPAA